VAAMIVFLHLFWQQVVGIGFDQHEPGNLAHVQVREGAYVVAAEGMTDQNIWSFAPVFRNALCSSWAMRTLVRGMGPGSLNPAPARS
jgi:hypothetical protein